MNHFHILPPLLRSSNHWRCSLTNGEGMRGVCLLLAIFLLWSVVGVGVAQEATDLESLKKEYTTKLTAASGAYQVAVGELTKKYIAGLTREKELAQKAGKLEEALMIDNEVKSITAGGEVPDKDDEKSPAGLKKIRGIYRTENARLTGMRERDEKPVRDDYVRKLDALVTKLTKEGKLQEAMSAKALKEGLLASSMTAQPGMALTAKTMSLNLPNGVMMTFCYCPAGDFKMGGAVDVTISKGFWMAQMECTQKQWVAVMGENPSKNKGDDFPVEEIDWNAAKKFITKLNEANTLPDGWKAALPTEAQWEYACRAGTKTDFSFGKSLRDSQANFGKKDGKTVAVGKYPANAWGLHDMHGNVYEWCQDWRAELAGGTDPKGPGGGEFKIMRGGGYANSMGSCASMNRMVFLPHEKGPNVGFRVVCNPP